MFQPHGGVFNRRNVVEFFHRIVLGTSGAISSQDARNVSGILAAKTGSEVGRYTLTLPSKYRRLLDVHATILGTDDAALGATTTGSFSFVRDNDIDGGAADGTIEVQFIQGTYADAEVTNALTLLIRVSVEM